jgi:enoyl-CoA hydratase/carnithine racemase
MTDIVTSRDGAVQRIQLNRPDKKNAITTAMYAALADAIVAADADRSVRVMLLHGAGDGFTAGNDLHDFLANPPQRGDPPAARFLQAISHAAKPIVAAVHGTAIGIGTTMLGHCDLVYASEGTRFHLPFVNLGLCPEGASSLLLPQLLATAAAAAQKLAAKPPQSLRLTKQLLRRALMPQIEAALAAELEAFAARLASPEAKEAFTAFFEKRPADFSKYD